MEQLITLCWTKSIFIPLMYKNRKKCKTVIDNVFENIKKSKMVWGIKVFKCFWGRVRRKISPYLHFTHYLYQISLINGTAPWLVISCQLYPTKSPKISYSTEDSICSCGSLVLGWPVHMESFPSKGGAWRSPVASYSQMRFTGHLTHPRLA